MEFPKNFGGMSEKMKELTGRGKALAERGKSMLKPPPVIFGAPRQTATELDTSWWHVPVFIQPQAMHRKELPDCTIKLLSLDGGGDGLEMCWRTLGSANTASSVTLSEGKLCLVPVAARKGAAGRRLAIITNRTFLAQNKVIRQLPAGSSNWTLRVENAEGNWESSHTYTLRVPPPDHDNGHFTLELRYTGLE